VNKEGLIPLLGGERDLFPPWEGFPFLFPSLEGLGVGNISGLSLTPRFNEGI